jgi:hypothetical protein
MSPEIESERVDQMGDKNRVAQCYSNWACKRHFSKLEKNVVKDSLKITTSKTANMYFRPRKFKEIYQSSAN